MGPCAINIEPCPRDQCKCDLFHSARFVRLIIILLAIFFQQILFVQWNLNGSLNRAKHTNVQSSFKCDIGSEPLHPAVQSRIMSMIQNQLFLHPIGTR